ncbi:OmpA family protein [Jinshanibacter sp. LJY008]|uniref:OmpA family protein n=1 Tax=Limnobaculum eriocheiris TaxID=2897391 RepID=A0A9X1SJN0_9GAMM|nr:OmpA family protein [Limnobaculum eriocheiris]MCD1125688.1 OmpA family protein [Limnobaculum eriocheiris]
MFRKNKISQVSQSSAWLRASAVGLITALFAFNVMARGAVDSDTMIINSMDESSNIPEVSTPGPAVIMKQTGLQYLPVGNIGDSLSQIVFYNPKRANNGGVGVANIYVDREFQGAIRSGQFSVFCLVPGKNIIEVYQNDAPNYTGKAAPKTMASLKGGKTYFVETNPDQNTGTPVSVNRVAAESQLFGYKSSATINRASAVKPCEYVGGMSQLGNVLFSFAGNKVSDIESGGINIVKNMAKHINSLPQIQRVNIVGHADPIGTPEFNQKLSEQRAETVKKLLISYGVPGSVLFTSGEGANNPTVNCDSLESKERNYCNRANRRVDALIKTNDSAE